MPDIYLNGDFLPEKEAKISVLDRAVQLGDGLFETIRGHFGKPAFLDRHLERMTASANFLGIPFDMKETDIREIIIELCERNNIEEAKIRFTLTRGIHKGGLELEGGKPSIIITADIYTPYSREKYSNGYRITVSKITHFSRRALAGMKTLNYLEFLMARDEASQAGVDEVILLNELGNVTECSSANIFCVIDNEIMTPDMASGILPGVVRDIVIELARRENIKVVERALPLGELLQADEVFITSSLRGIMPVYQIMEKTFSENRIVTVSLSDHYSAELDAACRD